MTTSSLDRALSTSRAFRNTSFHKATQLKSGSIESFFSGWDNPLSSLTGSRDQRTARQGYADYKGWLYSAVNALANEGAGQPACAGRLIGHESGTQRHSHLNSSKEYGEYIRSKMSKPLRAKAASTGIEVINSGPLYDLVNSPNQVQNRWSFTYSFIANLCLTGWSYLIYDGNEDGKPEILSVPTTWVTPIHEPTPFAKIKVKNPKKPGADGEEFTREQFTFAHLPNPSDPLSAFAPATAQALAIRIDDHIQTSQEAFFHNGIFPSVLVTVGKLPLGGTELVRPRLTGPQRRQVHAAIRKAMGSIANYGNPGIIDGLVENITRFSMDQNEMGWEKSEKTVRKRILSAFAVHPFILGEEMAGSYAQAYTVMERFFNRVNTYLDLLGLLLTNFFADETRGYGADNVLWWEPCEPKDPEQDRRWWEIAANKNFVTQNEFRTRLGLPPDEDMNQQYLDRLMAAEVTKLLAELGKGTVSKEQAFTYLQLIGLPDSSARSLTQTAPEPPEPAVAPPRPTSGVVSVNDENVSGLITGIRADLARLQTLPAGLIAG